MAPLPRARRFARLSTFLAGGTLAAALALPAAATAGWNGNLAFTGPDNVARTVWPDGTHLKAIRVAGQDATGPVGGWDSQGSKLIVGQGSLAEVHPFADVPAVGVFDFYTLLRGGYDADDRPMYGTSNSGIRRYVDLGGGSSQTQSVTQSTGPADGPATSADDTLVWQQPGVGIMIRRDAGNPAMTNEVLAADSSARNPTIDRGGRFAAWTTNQSGHPQVVVYDLWEQQAVPTFADHAGAANDLLPALSPDGRDLAFVSDRSGDWALYTIPVDGSAAPTKLPGTQLGGAFRAVSWQPAVRPELGETTITGDQQDEHAEHTIVRGTDVITPGTTDEEIVWERCTIRGAYDCRVIDGEHGETYRRDRDLDRGRYIRVVREVSGPAGKDTSTSPLPPVILDPLDPSTPDDPSTDDPATDDPTTPTGETPGSGAGEEPTKPTRTTPQTDATTATTATIAPAATTAPAPAAKPAAVAAPRPAATPKLRATIAADGAPGTRSAATVTVKRDGVGVGCAITGTALTSCTVDLYANPAVGARAASAKRTLVGTGTYRAAKGAKHLKVDVTLNATGRALLRRSPDGLKVSVAITGRPAAGAALKATGSATLVARTTAATVGGFATDRATLARAAKRQLDALARRARGTAVSIRVVGHTDGSTTDSAYLKRLGARRARAVAAYLRAHGVEAKATLASRGAAAPRATNATSAGRALNRRVEVRIER